MTLINLLPALAFVLLVVTRVGRMISTRHTTESLGVRASYGQEGGGARELDVTDFWPAGDSLIFWSSLKCREVLFDDFLG